MINKIIINGRAGAGKDTIGEYLKNKYGFIPISFAEGIYDIAYRYFEMKKKNRALLQAIGEKLREIDPLVWINYTFKKIENDPYEQKYVITDMRKEIEYSKGIERGFYPIRVIADLNTRIDRIIKRDGIMPDIKLFEADVETGADCFSMITIDNNGSFENLYRQIDDIIRGEM